ncbi:CHAD domain-containing protein [Actinomadura rubrobrunea]|uniref:CHAD domain-containing protein n=1 Tax=Actinomadura rubrobrunea TaxID=115335 RepID=A0A9W6PXA0_9ACTN|nr:CYTH and CHAD domain-containing protein [Actinomadura rubrobrunea]GLW66100.1 CHAD domain-containing protein [Actinomadura rubrobrunea]
MGHVEVEHKYDADADFGLPELSGLPGVAAVGEARSHQLHATYFDTDDLRLSARGITLRRRRGGDDAGWHLKMPVGPDSKSETRAPLGRANVVPARLANLVAAYTRGARLRPVATLETERTVLPLLDEDGALLAEIADDAVTGRVLRDGSEEDGSEENTASWREIEVELGAGGPDLLKAAGKRLRKAGARRSASSSKLGRLLDGAPQRAASSQAATGPNASAGEAVQAYLADQVAALLKYDPKARLAEEDAVHKMRVAVRRIRSALQSCRPLLARERTDPLRPELKWLADVLGEVRDLEVLRMRFTARLDGLGTGDAGREWLDELVRKEKSAYRRLNAALKQPRYFALLDALEALVADPPLTDRAARRADKELPRIVVRAWRRMERAHAAIAAAEDADEARHETRKAAKRARYAAELAAPVLGAAATRTARDAKSVQEAFGAYQDGVIATAHLREIAARLRTPEEAFTVGAVYGAERCDAQRALAGLERAWERIRKPSF